MRRDEETDRILWEAGGEPERSLLTNGVPPVPGWGVGAVEYM